jgi:hypothetical protein
MGAGTGETMDERSLRYPEWQVPLEDVIVEPDPTKLPDRIQTVETLIFQRLAQLESSNDGVVERDAINTALNVLRAVKRDRLAFPDWE